MDRSGLLELRNDVGGDTVNLDEYTGHQEKEDKRAQAFVTNCRNRIDQIESSMGDDWESPEYIKAVAQLKFLNECIEIIIVQQNMSQRLTTAMARTEEWTIDRELELEQTKLELNRMNANNAFLLKLIPKFTVKDC